MFQIIIDQNLGTHPEVFLTNPDTCGPADAALSMWLSVDCRGINSGIITSNENPFDRVRFYIICHHENEIW